MLPKLPLDDSAYAESRKEISRRAAEFDNFEDTFDKQSKIPDILREHFKRNAETDNDFEDSFPKKFVHGEQKLSRLHRDVQEMQREYSPDDDVDELEKLVN